MTLSPYLTPPAPLVSAGVIAFHAGDSLDFSLWFTFFVHVREYDTSLPARANQCPSSLSAAQFRAVANDCLVKRHTSEAADAFRTSLAENELVQGWFDKLHTRDQHALIYGVRCYVSAAFALLAK